MVTATDSFKTKSQFELWTSLIHGSKLEEETLKEKMKLEEVREMGAPSSYLTVLLHITSFAPGYK